MWRLPMAVALMLLAACSSGDQVDPMSAVLATYYDDTLGQNFRIFDQTAKHKLIIAVDGSVAPTRAPPDSQVMGAAQRWLRSQGRTCIMGESGTAQRGQYQLGYSCAPGVTAAPAPTEHAPQDDDPGL